MKKKFALFFTMLLSIVLVNGCIASSTPATLLVQSETLLGDYKEGVDGGFSHRWLAYIIEPQKGSTETTYFVELNSQRLGPYSGLSWLFRFSDDGEHIAFAAKRDEKWVIVVDGQEKWEYKSLGWCEYAWTPNLEGSSFIPQTSAAILKFSPAGDQLAYYVITNDTEHNIFLNGEAGPSFLSISVNIRFVDGKLCYWTWNAADKPSYVYGDKILGYYNKAWETKYSSDNKHFVFVAEKQGELVLVADGQEQKLGGENAGYNIGPSGEVAYAVKSGESVKVYFSGRELPGKYDEITELTISPDGKHLAFWARQDSTWSLVTDNEIYSGYDGYYYYSCGGEHYSIFWGEDPENIAYFAIIDKHVVLVLNGQQQPLVKFSGLIINQNVDVESDRFGEEVLNGQTIDRQALVQYLLEREQLQCDPFAVTMFQGKLAYIETGEKESFMVIGTDRMGPYASINSALLTSEDNEHYAYFISTDKGKQLILDGKLMDWAYDATYKPQFLSGKGIAFLGIREGKVYNVFYPY
jgi:hypothetical protein